MKPISIRHGTTKDGLRIPYVRVGAGIPFVYMPGCFGNIDGMSSLDEFKHGFAERFDFISYDGRGRGYAPRGISSCTREDVQADLEAVLEATSPGRFVLWAMCMEAPAAIDFAVRCPDQLMALVLWIPWTGGGVIASEALRDLAGQRTGDAQDWQIFLRYFATLVHHPASDAEVDADVENLAANMTQADFAVLHRDFDATPDVLPLLPCLTVPTLVMCPRGARMSRPSDAVNIAARIPQGRAVVLDGSLIAPVGDLTEQALSAIDEFLAEFVGRDRKQPPRQLLSEREAQVLCLLARGETNHGVATELVISERTVERHLSNVYTKLGVRGRAEAAAWAVRSGLV